MSNLIKNLLTFCLFLLVASNLVAQSADLKLEYQTSPSPAIISVGDTLQVRYEVSNTGLTDATGSQMTINLSAGFQIVETMPTVGTFAANVWNIGTVPSEESEILLVFITKTSDGLGTLEAEISQMTGGGPDPDSTPNNEDANEDDFQSFCISIIKEFYQPQVITLSAGDGMMNVQWFRNDTLIVGADSIDFDATESGIYYFNADASPCELGGCCPVQLKEVPPPPCSVVALVAEIACNDNGSPTIATDDYIDFKIMTTGERLSGGFVLSADNGTITKQDGSAATGLQYGVDSLFRMQNGAAGAGDIQIIITDNTDNTCKDTLIIIDPGVCSTPVCNMVLSLAPDDCDTGDNSYELAGTVTFSTPPTTGTLTILVDGVAQETFNAPFTNPQVISITDLMSDGLLHSVTSEFSDAATCQVQMNFNAPAPCMVSSTCIVSATVDIGTCDNNDNRYDVAGNLTFSDAPASGTLTVSVGPFQQVFSAPFTSPKAYTLSGLTADGSGHDLSVIFSADAFCRFDTSYIAPAGCDPVACGVTMTATPGTCTNNKFDLMGNISFTNAPSTGTLSISLGGETMTFAPPFTSPQAYTFSNLLADGSTGSLTASFSDDLTCSATINFNAPVACDNVTCAVSLDLVPSACSDNKYSLSGTVSTVNAPTTGTLIIASGGTTYLTIAMPSASPISFTIPGLAANGQQLVFDAAFSADANCTDTITITAPATCIGTCSMTAAIANVQCNDNESDTSTDDYTTFELNPTGTNLGGTYTVTAPSGPVYLLSGGLAVNVPYGQATTFRLTNGSSGAGNLTINIEDNSTPNCVEGPLTIPDPDICSCESPIGVVTTSQTTCFGSDSNTDGMLILTSVMTGDKINYSTGTTYTGNANYTNALTIGTLPDTIVQNLTNPTDSQAYTIRIFNASTTCFVDTTIYLIEKTCTCTDPILANLTDESICLGENFMAANLTTSVTNDIPVTYQWFNNDGINNSGTGVIAGQITATLTNLPTTAGTYSYKVVATNTRPGGCSAEKIVNLVITPTTTGLEIYNGCRGDGYSVVVGSTTYNEANPTGMEMLTAANGCDSVVTVSLVYKTNTTGNQTYDGCEGDGYEVVVGSTTYNESNPTGTETVTASNGCDSVVTINLVYKPNTIGTETYDGCQGDGYAVLVGSTTYNEANPTGSETLAAVNGCDSVVAINLVYKPNATGTAAYDGCEGDGYEVVVGSTTYNEANPSGSETLAASNGCDSVVTVNLVFKSNAKGTELYDGCEGDGYEVVVGTTTYNEDNPTGMETLAASNGCDSIVTVGLVYKSNTTGTAAYDGCEGDGYEVIVGSTTYNEANPTGTETLTSATGCDSVVTVNLVFKPSKTGASLYDSCEGDGYSVVVGSTTYNEINPAGMETLTAADGCDSVVTISLVFKTNTTGTAIYDGCEGDGYEIVVGTTTYNEANPTGIETITATNGCDSVVTINLVYKPTVTGLELYDGCQGDGYEKIIGTTLSIVYVAAQQRHIQFS